MTSQHDRDADLKDEELSQLFVNAIRRDLSRSLLRHKIELLGYSVKITPGYILLTIRAWKKEERLVSFVGAESVRKVFVKAARLAQAGKLDWARDKYV